ncbi:MAG: hypothetical protein ACI8QS_002248 [Planctomycetota bacterium]|jgi:hypothetical protein
MKNTMRPRPLGFRLLCNACLIGISALSFAGCKSNAFLSLDPWAESVHEQPSDAWMSGGRYASGAIVSSDPPPYVAEEEGRLATAGQSAEKNTVLGGLEPAPRGTAPLLAWDGDVIDGPTPGTVVEREDLTNGLETAPGGRMYLLQLYQDVLDERDVLSDEVRALRKALGDAQARIDDTSASTSGLSTRLDMLESEVERLVTENEDLAGRLTTVQIRRLEAEKMLLEARIDWYRNRASEEDADELGPTGTTTAVNTNSPSGGLADGSQR